MVKEPEVTIHHLRVRDRSKEKPGEVMSWFELTVIFTMSEGEDYFLGPLQEWYPSLAVDDPDAHDFERYFLWKVLQKQGIGFLDILNSLPVDAYQHDFYRCNVKGLDMLHKDRKGRWRFREFFTKTPVTLACLEELKTMKANSQHSYKTIPTQYFSHILQTLGMFWD